MLLALLASLQAPHAPLPDGHVHPVQHLVTVSAPPPTLPLDVVDVDGADVRAIVTPTELAALRANGHDVTVEIEDLAAHYARRLAAAPSATQRQGNHYAQWLTPTFGQGSLGGYYTFDEVVAVLDQLHAAYPHLIAPRTSLGQTIEGREIWMVKVSDNPNVDEDEPELRIDSMHHAREPQAMQTTLYFLSYLLEEYGHDPLVTYVVDERELFVVPVVNPDGYEYNRAQAPGGGGLWRKNRRANAGGSFGVDLNRNYPFMWGMPGSSGDPTSAIYRGTAPASEPESQAILGLVGGRTFRTALSVHTYGNEWLAPLGHTTQHVPDWDDVAELGELACEFNGYEHGPASIVNTITSGTSRDNDYGNHGIYSWTPEIGGSADGFWPAQSRIVPLAHENRLAFLRTALGAGPWLRWIDGGLVDLGDGDGSFEPGESVGLDPRLRNSGREDSPGATLTLSTPSPWAVAAAPTASLTAASFADAQIASTLRLDLSPQTPPGTRVPYSVQVDDGVRSFTVDGELVVGLRTVASFDFEGPDDQGWAVGPPNDASTGEWTRDDPVGTAAQPETDTSDPGTHCWFTGQGQPGGSVGANDVDGGTTTLVSPPFDLSTSWSATLRYQRWYSNDQGANPGDDVFVVELSDDDGATWTTAEVVGPGGPGTSGGWNEATIDVSAHVALTADVRVRFQASDLNGGSIVEAAIDDVVLVAADDPTCPPAVNHCPRTPNAWTAGAAISVSGSSSVQSDDLVLHVVDANPSGFGLFFYGQGRAQAPTGNGNVCIAGVFARLPVVLSDGSGAANLALDLASAPAPIASGETWSFQYWLRDQGGAGFNFSDAVEVTFCP